MALKFLNKKGWHTGSLRNIENVWKAEQKHGQEQKKLEELRKQIISEREAQEFRQLQEQAGLVPKQERLDFLYDSGLSVGKPSTEDYLLGKPIDQLKEESDISKVAATPGSLFVDEKPYSANEQWRKIHSDPLLLIRQQEQAALSRIKNNPVKMEMIKKEVENKKRKKEEKRRLKAERKKQKREEKKKMSKAYDNSSDSSSDDGGGSRNSESVTVNQSDDRKVYSKSTDFGRSLGGRISRDDYDNHVDHSTKDKKGDWSDKRSSSSHSYERNCSDDNHNHKDKKGHRSSEHLFKESSPSSDRHQEYHSGSDHDYKDKKRHHSDEERGYKLREQKEYKPRARDRETSKESSPPSTYDKEPRTSHSKSCGTGDLEFKRASSSRPIDANGRPLPPLPKKQIKLSEEERTARLLEMQKDANLHEEQRWQRLKNASVADALEQQRDAIKSSGHNFLDSTNRSVYGTEKGGSASVEESVRRRTHFLEKHRSEDSSRAFRR